MKEYINKIVEEFTYMEEVNNMKTVKTPAAEYFFMVNTNASKIDAEKSYIYFTAIEK